MFKYTYIYIEVNDGEFGGLVVKITNGFLSPVELPPVDGFRLFALKQHVSNMLIHRCGLTDGFTYAHVLHYFHMCDIAVFVYIQICT